jgi:hypothetical protein
MTVVGRLARTGLRKGLLEGSRPWLYTGTAAFALRILAMFREKDQTVFKDELKPGQHLEIRAVPPNKR